MAHRTISKRREEIELSTRKKLIGCLYNVSWSVKKRRGRSQNPLKDDIVAVENGEADLVKEENGVSTISSIDESIKSNGFLLCAFALCLFYFGTDMWIHLWL